ncbi:unnamed protein product, partial [Vitis vinifera]
MLHPKYKIPKITSQRSVISIKLPKIQINQKSHISSLLCLLFGSLFFCVSPPNLYFSPSNSYRLISVLTPVRVLRGVRICSFVIQFADLNLDGSKEAYHPG